MKKLNNRGVKGIAQTAAVVLMIVTLVVGVGVGAVLFGMYRYGFPVPTPTDLIEQIDQLETQVTGLEGQLTGLEGQLTGLEGQITAAAAEKAALETTITELNEWLDRALGMNLFISGEAPLEPVTVLNPLEWTLSGEIPLGGLLDLTGGLSTFGENEQVAAELAVEQVNAFLTALGANWTLVLLIEDCATSPPIALEKVESLAARGVKLMVGPLSSGSLRAIKGYIEANKILAISQSSTAPDLAIPDDWIYRFCPTDEFGQGPADGRIFYDDGIRYIIPVARNDAWGVGLETAGKLKFESLGGTFLPGIRYPEDAVEFTVEAADLASKVSNAIATYGADQVAVWHISFEELVPFITASLAYDVLDDVMWYGSDGMAGSSDLLADPEVTDFIVSVGYPCTIFGVRPYATGKWEVVRQEGLDVLGREPESYSYGVYDIVWAYALSLLIVDEYNAEAVREVLPTVVARYSGASGIIELDANGDRKEGDMDIWQILEDPESPGVYDWVIPVGTWSLAEDSVTWYVPR